MIIHSHLRLQGSKEWQEIDITVSQLLGKKFLNITTLHEDTLWVFSKINRLCQTTSELINFCASMDMNSRMVLPYSMCRGCKGFSTLPYWKETMPLFRTNLSCSRTSLTGRRWNKTIDKWSPTLKQLYQIHAQKFNYRYRITPWKFPFSDHRQINVHTFIQA